MKKIMNPDELEIPDENQTSAFEARFQAIKAQYKEREFVAVEKPEQVGFLKNDSDEKKHATVMNARAQRITNNNSYKFRPKHQSFTAPSRMIRKDVNNFKMRIGGKSVSVGKVLSN